MYNFHVIIALTRLVIKSCWGNNVDNRFWAVATQIEKKENGKREFDVLTQRKLLKTCFDKWHIPLSTRCLWCLKSKDHIYNCDTNQPD